MDHPILEGQYKSLGIIDMPTITNPAYISEIQTPGIPQLIGDGIINQDDLIGAQDKKSMVDRIMDVEDPVITHDIISDIYSVISINNIIGKEQSFDYHPERNELPVNTNQQEYLQESQGGKLKLLESLKTVEGLASIKGLNEVQIQKKFNLTKADLDGLVDESGQKVNISTYIKGSTKATAGPPAGLTPTEKLQWYKDN